MSGTDVKLVQSTIVVSCNDGRVSITMVIIIVVVPELCSAAILLNADGEGKGRSCRCCLSYLQKNRSFEL